MKLVLRSLSRAIETLGRSLTVIEREGAASAIEADVLETLKAGVIQNFEVAYELCWKFIKRWIEQNVGSTVADGVTRRELFRLGAENRLIDDVDLWMRFHSHRNESAHTYDSETAEDVYSVAGDFLAAARSLLDALEARND